MERRHEVREGELAEVAHRDSDAADRLIGNGDLEGDRRSAVGRRGNLDREGRVLLARGQGHARVSAGIRRRAHCSQLRAPCLALDDVVDRGIRQTEH